MLAYLYKRVPLLNGVVVFILDHCFAWFLPKWRKQGRLVLKALTRYINYHEDLLPAENVAELRQNRMQLTVALRTGDKETTKNLTAKFDTMLEATPGGKLNVWAENVEVFFVILAIFMGLRYYVVQPFRIPTGSMQPSLNGIRAFDQEQDPGFWEKAVNFVCLGSSYVHEVADRDKKIVAFEPAIKYLLFTVTRVRFDDGSVIEIPAAEAETQRLFLRQSPAPGAERNTPYRSFKQGDTIVNARFDAGDLILVNKMAYHFRKPERGEVFVFDTRGITGISQKNTQTGQEGGTHYIKRLCGVPGDTLSIADSQLFVNGKPAQEWQIQRVAAGQPPYQACGYVALPPPASMWDSGKYYITQGGSVHLSNNSKTPYLREYVALGDNSTVVNSFDSRYWGPVKQYNVIGPASFCLWPFTWHWGVIP